MISEPSLTATTLILSISLPSFLRFDVVELDYRIGAYEDDESISIGKKCEWIQMVLKSFKQALNGSKLQFGLHLLFSIFRVSESDFTDHSIFLEHIGKELLPICNACRSYKFEISFYWNYGTAKDVIAGILQFVEIDLCSDVQFSFYFDNGVEPVNEELPIEVIGNWLNHTLDESSGGQKHKGRFLDIECQWDNKFENVEEMMGHLEKVKVNLIDILT